MNKRLFYTICSTVSGICLAIWIGVFFVHYASKKPTPSPVPSPPQAAPVEEDKSSAIRVSALNHYLLVSENGAVSVYCVYDNGYKSLKNVLDINVDTLRANDRKEFERGIVVHDSEDLAFLIEDYVS